MAYLVAVVVAWKYPLTRDQHREVQREVRKQRHKTEQGSGNRRWVMKVQRVETEKDVWKFIQVQFEIYRGNPYWIPPMISDVEFVLDRENNPFYSHSQAEFFMAKEQGQVLGRVAVLDHSLYNKYHQSKTAFFYLFEAVDNLQVARLLFAAAIDWARQHSLRKMIGPLGMHAGDGHGVLVRGFRRRPGMGISWNFPYYEGLLEQAGFEKLVDSFSAQVSIRDALEKNRARIQRIRQVAKKVKKHRGFRIMTFDSKQEVRKQATRLVPELKRVYNKSFAGLPLFWPMDEEGMQRVVDRFLAIADPRLIRLVMKGADVVGFVLTYPNIVPGIRRAGGKLWPLGWLWIMLERYRSNWMDLNGIGILPKYQGLGAAIVLYAELAKILEESRFEWAVANQVSEKNVENLREVQAFGVEFDRVHRVYQRLL